MDFDLKPKRDTLKGTSILAGRRLRRLLWIPTSFLVYSYPQAHTAFCTKAPLPQTSGHLLCQSHSLWQNSYWSRRKSLKSAGWKHSPVFPQVSCRHDTPSLLGLCQPSSPMTTVTVNNDEVWIAIGKSFPSSQGTFSFPPFIFCPSSSPPWSHQFWLRVGTMFGFLSALSQDVTLGEEGCWATKDYDLSFKGHCGLPLV